METTYKMLLKRKLNFVRNLNSDPCTRTLINGLIEETKGKREKISRNSILSELEGIYTREIGNSEEKSKLCDIHYKFKPTCTHFVPQLFLDSSSTIPVGKGIVEEESRKS
ncbi:hypothetical protein BpHYR1_025203 [Brachionus plicatilis]|uniref:Uncharacterized protein n=1 Tax=Brachionus plicatilis TaxID=10195 RepID=A0A3M7PPZ0_BRAPC|nr:hypothetical protein BpHYR1_025203 [Brachionus plicatilis]